jgi:hypothetical protein
MILMLIPLLLDLIFNRRQIKSYLPLLPPILVTGFWLLYHFSQTGWWFTVPGRDTVIPSSLSLYLNSLRFVASVFFLRQYRFLLTLAALLSTLYLYLHARQKFQKLWSPNVILLLSAHCTLLIIFAATGEFIPRYAIALLPAYTVLCPHLIFSALPKPNSYLTILTIVIIFTLSLHPHSPTPANALELRLNEDLSYQDHIQLGLQAAEFLEANYPGVPIIGDFPQSYQLTEPILGYVSKPLNFINCTDQRALRSLGEVGSAILYLHPYHYTQITCQNLLAQFPFTPLKNFQVNGKWVKLFIYETKP